MNAERFIASRMRFKGNLTVIAIAVSFLVIIVSLSVSGGFRNEIRASLSDTYGDVLVPSSKEIPELSSIEGVTKVNPVVFKAGIVKSGLHIRGVQFKGVASTDSSSLQVDIPASFASSMHLEKGGRMMAYFVIGDKVKARNFTVREIFDDKVSGGPAVTLITSIKDVQRIEGLGNEEYSALELQLDKSLRTRSSMKLKAAEISLISGLYSSSLPDRFPQLFDWMDLIDVNVVAILALMIIVAGFNMISGLLIHLFRNISTIGTLKTLGMDNAGIGRIFIRTASSVVFKGMLAGNAVALLFCVVQDRTHFLKLNPDNYFLSFVPVSINVPSILLTDAIAWLAIMLMLLIPTLFISGVDPAKTVRSL